MNHLLAEIYYGIFYYLSRPVIQICSFVFKQWNVVAARVYKRELVIDDYEVQIAKLNLSSDGISEYFKNGHLIRKLTFKSEFEGEVDIFRRTPNTPTKKKEIPPRLSRCEFLLLLKYLPNIEEIDLTESGSFTYYISFLFFAKLQHIKKITTLPFESFYGVSGYHEYLSTCFRFCGTLTSLYLEYTEDTMGYTCSGVGILDMLSQFKNLKQLVFYNNYSDNSITFRIQERCPQLTDLVCTSDLNCSQRAVQEWLELRVEPNVKLNKGLRRLNLNLPSLPIYYTRYLTSYLANMLHTVNIQATLGLYDLIEDVGMEDTLMLMEKLGKLNNVCISFMKNHKFPTLLTHKLKMSKWFQVVNAFKGNKKALCTVKFCGTSPPQDYFEYSSSDKQLVLTYGLDDVDYYGLENEIEDADYYRRRGYGSIYGAYESLPEFPLPTISISTIGPEIIDRLELDLNKVADDFIMKFLKYVFINCINLQYFKVTGCLQIQGCPNQRKNGLDGIQNNLKMVHFLSSAPANNLFKTISTYLPDIEVLVLGSRGRFNSNLDLTPFKCFKKCYIVVQQTSNDKCEALNIKFKYTDGKKQWYYYDGTVKKALVRQDIRSTIYLCRSLTFTCKKDTEFNVCFGTDKSLLNFDIDKPHVSCYCIAMDLITLKNK
ncbi:hypothetical protein BDF21DRAFT_468569 [Thamnidium elegans]|nr:hypothetical protein BDF21DRAFT_468569 [Thamnidium elegans]